MNMKHSSSKKFRRPRSNTDNDQRVEEQVKEVPVPPDTLSLMSFGGVREIGMNLCAYKYNGKYLIVDMGIGFDQDLPLSSHNKIVVANIDLLEQERENVIGIVITHGHDDHIAGITHVWDRIRCPIYATAFPAALITRKTEQEQESARRINQEHPNDQKWYDIRDNLHIVQQGGWMEIGDFAVRFVNITHSIPESSAVAIRVNNKTRDTVIHTGDWKIDVNPVIGNVTDERALQEIGDEGVMTLVCDSTNIMDLHNDRSMRSESSVAAGLERLIRNAEGKRVLISCISTNVARVKTCFDIAKRCGRKLCLVGRSLLKVHEVALATGYWDPRDCPLTDDEGGKAPRGSVLFMCTGSQGESGSSIERISRIPECTRCNVKVEPGDVVIFSARTISGNERAVNNVVNNFAEKGVQVTFPSANNHIHVSGHPVQEDVKQMYQWTKPRFVIPVHGEPQHLVKHAEVAASCGIDTYPLRNGEEIMLTQAGVRSVRRFKTSKLMVDGSVLLPVDGNAVREKRGLQRGLVVIVIHSEHIKIDAFGMYDDNYAFKQELTTVVRKRLQQITHSKQVTHYETVRDVVDYVSAWIKEFQNRLPLVRVHILGKIRNYTHKSRDDRRNQPNDAESAAETEAADIA